MTIALIVLCGILMGALNFGCFLLGYYVREKRKDESALEVNDTNKEAVASIMRWMNYGGK